MPLVAAFFLTSFSPAIVSPPSSWLADAQFVYQPNRSTTPSYPYWATQEKKSEQLQCQEILGAPHIHYTLNLKLSNAARVFWFLTNFTERPIAPVRWKTCLFPWGGHVTLQWTFRPKIEVLIVSIVACSARSHPVERKRSQRIWARTSSGEMISSYRVPSYFNQCGHKTLSVLH